MQSIMLRISCYSSRLPSRMSPFAAPTLSSTRSEPWRRQSQLSRKLSSSRCCGSSELVESGTGVNSKMSQLESLLGRRWLMQTPSTKISRIVLSNLSEASASEGSQGDLGNLRFSLQDMTADNLEIQLQEEKPSPTFYVIRDDLLHPLLGGNKLRKLDALLPQLEDCRATDVVTCGGCQSAHTAALAFACAEQGITAHLLLRGEKPAIPTGYNLLSSMYGHNNYVPRSEYADRSVMLRKHAARVAGSSGTVIWLDGPGDGLTTAQGSQSKVVIVKEGAGDPIALLGFIRLVHYLSQPSVFGSDHRLQIVVDTGTGTTAVGLALGVLLLGLPWKVRGIMLADSAEGYELHKFQLISAFCQQHSLPLPDVHHLPLSWEERWRPRKFGNIFPGEVRTCQSVGQQTGILLDPIYTLAGWEAATRLCLQIENAGEEHSHSKVVMLHTGGTLGLFGLAQRYPAEFG